MSVRPVWESRRLLLAQALSYGGGTSSNPTIPPQFLPLIQASVGQEVQQQGLNPLSQYDAGNPMGVQGLTPSEQTAMGYSLGNLQQSPLLGLAGQAAENMAGMAGNGPFTGYYNPQNSMSLQQMMQLMNPSIGQGGDIGATAGNGYPAGSGPPSGSGSGAGTPAPPGSTPPPPPAGQGTYTGGGFPGSTGPSNPAAAFTTAPGNYSQMTPQQQRAAAMADNPGGGGIFGLQRALGNTNLMAGAQAQGPQNIPGLQYTGANHEWGGNNAIGAAGAQAGMTPAQMAAWTVQGMANQNPSMQAYLANAGNGRTPPPGIGGQMTQFAPNSFNAGNHQFDTGNGGTFGQPPKPPTQTGQSTLNGKVGQR